VNDPVESRNLIDLDAVSRSFGAIRAVDGVSFQVRAGEVHALCGHNGAGKSTVVKMITGLVQPDGGRILINGDESPIRSPQEAQRRGIALVDQELSVVPILTVADNILLGGMDEPFVNRPRAARARVRELLDLVGLADVDPTDSTADLSMGGRQLVEIARALGRRAKLLVLDEPTATLSSNEIEHVFTAVRQVAASGCGVIYVSHRLDEVLELCNRVTVLRDGKLVDTAEAKTIDIDQLVSMMLGDIAPAPVPSLPDAGRGAGRAVRIKDLSVGTRTSGFGLEASHGHVYALAGQVGSGATEVLRAMAGLEPTAYGLVEIGGKRMRLGSPGAAVKSGVSYLSNDRKGDGLFLGLSARENLISTRLRKVSRGPFINMAALRKTAAKLIGIIRIGTERLPEPVLNFSGGNQQKIFLGRTLEVPEIELLLLDEPTRGVDVKGRIEIHNLIRDAARDGTTVIFASTEIDEILDLADDIVTMRSGRIVGRHPRGEVDTELLLAEMTHGRPEGATS